jgi:Ca2+-binding EF-hand superfamily protein
VLDGDKSGSLDLAEFARFLKHIDALQKRIANNLDSDTLAKLDLQIDRLFRKVDADHSGYIETRELYDLLKPLRPGKLSVADCEQIIAGFDRDSDGRLDQAEFHAIVKAELQENMTRPLKDVENTKGILRQLDRDRDGRLSVSEFKDALFKEMAVKNLADEDVDALVHLLDQDGDELIEIGEFLAVVQKAGLIDFSDEAAGGLNTE